MARTEGVWQEINGSYLTTQWAEGRNILINGTNKYLNFGIISGTSGYGFRDNGGVLQVKDSGGAWNNVMSGNGDFAASNNRATLQYFPDDTEWKAGHSITVSTTAPTDPKVNDLWFDIS
jgi:maltose-binding protein MalE